MSRRLRNPLLFLLLGAVINAALAMGIIWFRPMGEGERQGYRFHETWYARWDGLGLTRLYWWADAAPQLPPEARPLPGWSALHRVPRPYPTRQEFASARVPVGCHEFAAGWPLRSFLFKYDVHMGGPLMNELVIRSGIELPPRRIPIPGDTRSYPRAIPLRIIPIGMALNTLLFAAIAAFAWHAALAARCARRRRQNQCAKCGYSRAGLAHNNRCPECAASGVDCESCTLGVPRDGPAMGERGGRGPREARGRLLKSFHLSPEGVCRPLPRT